MSDKNKLFDDNYRENFLRTADPLTLNDYLKNMEKLARKGGKYLEMYNKDLYYLINLSSCNILILELSKKTIKNIIL